MNASPNVNELAKRFWDLWQEQVASIMNDKDFVQTLLEMMQKSPFSATHANATPNAKDLYANPFFQSAAPPFGGDAATYSAVMVAVDECAKRLKSMERRLELLEAALIDGARAKSGTAERPRKRDAKPRAAQRTKKRRK